MASCAHRAWSCESPRLISSTTKTSSVARPARSRSRRLMPRTTSSAPAPSCGGAARRSATRCTTAGSRIASRVAWGPICRRAARSSSSMCYSCTTWRRGRVAMTWCNSLSSPATVPGATRPRTWPRARAASCASPRAPIVTRAPSPFVKIRDASAIRRRS